MAKVVAAPNQKAPPQEQCSECCFWKKTTPGMGECHRHPPVTVHEFPIVLGTNWCGEFKRKT